MNNDGNLWGPEQRKRGHHNKGETSFMLGIEILVISRLSSTASTLEILRKALLGRTKLHRMSPNARSVELVSHQRCGEEVYEQSKDRQHQSNRFFNFLADLFWSLIFSKFILKLSKGRHPGRTVLSSPRHSKRIETASGPYRSEAGGDNA